MHHAARRSVAGCRDVEGVPATLFLGADFAPSAQAYLITAVEC